MSHGGGSERWLVSYADFITLLMVLFVVLYSMSQVDVEKYKTLATSLRAAFSGGEMPAVIDPQIDLGGGVSESDSPAPIVIPGIPHTGVDSVEVAGELTDMLASSDIGGMVSVQNNLEGVLISLSEQLLFEPGTNHLAEEAFLVLDVVAEMLHNIDNEVRVIGYTDDTPPQDPMYRDTWDLSLARALIIVRYLQDRGIDPGRLIAAGRGEHSPLFYNDSEKHRALNSRAEIVVIYPMESDIVDSEFFQGTDFNPDELPINISDSDSIDQSAGNEP